MKEEIRRYKKVELALQNLRYWDLIRQETAETELPKSVLRNYFFKVESGTLPLALVNEKGFIVDQNASSAILIRLRITCSHLKELGLSLNLK